MKTLSQAQLKYPCLLCAATLVMILLPIMAELMSWVIILTLCSIVVCLGRARKNIPDVNNTTLNLLSVLCLGLLILFYKDFGLLITMINLLVVACSLKFLMMKTTADFHLVAVVLMFLVAAGFIFNQSAIFAVYYACSIFLIFCLSYILNKGHLSIYRSVLQTGKLLVQALPIAFLLFLVAPRLPPFWQMPQDKGTETGLSETITPGDIANLAQSDDLVFRAEFSSELPQPIERYWRAIVLDYFDGKTWSIAQETLVQDAVLMNEYRGETWRYLIVAEPNETKWLYALDIPQVVQNFSSQNIFVSKEYQLFNAKSSQNRQLYIVNSYHQMPLNLHKQKLNFDKYLQVPNDGNPQTRALIAKLAEKDMSTPELINKISTIFDPQLFSYTLRPPLMQSDPIDQFLFTFQRGFCSHYASAMTYMLRLAGVPTRMVTGYQGGEEQAGNIITVRQYDAHAWIEAWDDQEGWIRFDPTALVAPNRMTAGLLSSLRDNEESLVEGNEFMRTIAGLPGLSNINDLVVLINHNWSQFVLNYDQESQLNIVKKLFGSANIKNLITFLLFAFMAIGVLLVLFFVPWKRLLFSKSIEPEYIFVNFLKKRGWNKQRSETLAQFVKRIDKEFPPPEAQALHAFTESYYALQFANTGTNEQLSKALKRCLNQIKTRKQP